MRVIKESDTFEKMKHLKSGIACIIIFISSITFESGCAPTKKQSQEPEKKLPGTIAISPSSFQCVGTVIESDERTINFSVIKILQRGSSLIYPVSAGDTIVAIFQSTNKTDFSNLKSVELVVEERLKLNSEKPEFVVKQIR
jgi:hypothetical protein